LALSAPVTLNAVSKPFHVYELVKLPLTIHHQHEFYTSLATDIAIIAYHRDADYLLQITAGKE